MRGWRDCPTSPRQPADRLTLRATPGQPTDRQPTSAQRAPTMPPPTGPFSSGTYLVGSEISPGTWHTNGGSQCYYERDRDTNDTVSWIIANDNFTGPTMITVSSSDVLVTFHGDCTWTKR